MNSHDLSNPWRPAVLAAAGALALLGLSLGCGAQNVEGPAPQPRQQTCQSLSRLAPAFMETLKDKKADSLKTMIEKGKLLEEGADGSPPPLITILRVTVETMNRFSADPPEAGAADGELCNDFLTPPPSRANRMCEARRMMKTFVHEGKGLETLKLLDPFVAGLMDYIVGKPPASEVPHYELAQVLSNTCSKAYCHTEDVLDVVGGFLAFITPTAADPHRPQTVMNTLNALLNNPAIGSLLDTTTNTLTEQDLIALGDVLLQTTQALPTDKDKFVQAFHKDIEVKINDLLTNTLKISRTDPKYKDLRLAIDAVIGGHDKQVQSNPPPTAQQLYGTRPPLLFAMLDPASPTPILRPLQGLLYCTTKNDPNKAMLKLVYALGFKTQLIGLRDIMKALTELTAQDERGTILNFTKELLGAVGDNEEGVDAVKKLCTTMFDATKPTDGGKSVAETMTPIVADLFHQGAVQELLCVADTLLYGCAGGSQPSCAQPTSP